MVRKIVAGAARNSTPTLTETTNNICELCAPDKSREQLRYENDIHLSDNPGTQILKVVIIAQDQWHQGDRSVLQQQKNR